MPKSSNLRAETARRNGAQSRGPKTEEGLHRSQSARLRHGIYATRCFTLPGEPQAQFLALQAEIRAYWQPTGALPAMLVEQLVGNLWSTQRLLAAKTEHVLDHRVSVASAHPALRDDMKLNLMAELSTLVAGGTRERANAELNHLSRERERLTRELLRLEKRPATSGSSQMSLIINNRQHPDIPASDDAEPVEGTIFEMPYAVKATNEPVPASFCEPAPAAEGPAPEPTPESAPEAEKEPAAPILSWAQDPFRNRRKHHPRRIHPKRQVTMIIVLLATHRRRKHRHLLVRCRQRVKKRLRPRQRNERITRAKNREHRNVNRV